MTSLPYTKAPQNGLSFAICDEPFTAADKPTKYVMRKFMKIVESITLDYAANAEIEQKLEAHAAEDRPMIRDGLETIMNGGGSVTVGIWVNTMRQLWPDRSNEEMKRIFKIIMADFSNMVKRSENGSYVWSNRLSGDDDIDMTSPTAQLAKAQIEYTAMIMQMMQQSGQFTKAQIVQQFTARSGMHGQMADMLVQHVFDQVSGSISGPVAGVYQWVETKRETGLSFLKGLDGYTPRA